MLRRSETSDTLFSLLFGNCCTIVYHCVPLKFTSAVGKNRDSETALEGLPQRAGDCHGPRSSSPGPETFHSEVAGTGDLHSSGPVSVRRRGKEGEGRHTVAMSFWRFLFVFLVGALLGKGP